MDTDEPSAAEPQPQRYGVRELVRAFGRRLVAVECGTVSKSPGPLEAALLWRQVAQAAKAVTSHRTPNSCRLCAQLHHCRTNNHEGSGHGLHGLARVESVRIRAIHVYHPHVHIGVYSCSFVVT